MNKYFRIFVPLAIITIMAGCVTGHKASKEIHIKPWAENPRFWQFRGQPVLLLGASSDDNLFQWPADILLPHLDSMKSVGANYIRNTMSDRQDKGFEARAFKLLDNGKYDLAQWGDEYWERFETMLRETSARNIVVQVEIWDRFDHSRDQWLSDPYNPKNNINYTFEESKLDSVYPNHPGTNQQPFFYTVPSLDNNLVLLPYQQAFVKKILEYSLKYDHVLYCIDNETKGAENWAVYWAGFVQENARGKEIYVTQMWDDWDVKTEMHKRTIDHPQRYGYIDLSQNSQLPGRPNWDNPQYVFSYIAGNPRPVNSTKIYGSDSGSWFSRGITTQHALQSFCRNVLGGFASSRFHRPSSGLGLCQLSMNAIKTIRQIEEHFKLWQVAPHMELINDNGDNNAYLSALPGKFYLLYLPEGGKVTLNLENQTGKFNTKWISVDKAEWGKTETIKGGGMVELESGYEHGCFIVITK